MKIALVADLHIGVRDDAEVFLNQTKDFLDNYFFPYLKKNNIGTVIDLGDTFDRRKYLNLVTMQMAKDHWYDVLENNNIDLYEIVGNHCAYYRTTNSVNSNQIMSENYNCAKVVVKYGPHQVEFDGVKIDLVPWINSENQKECLDFMKKSTAEIVMGHFEFKGYEMYRGQPAKKGLDSKIVNGYDVVLSGHYHHKNGPYLGSPYQMVWSDYGDRRGFHVFDTNTRELEFIEYPKQMFHKLTYDDSEAESLEDTINFNSDNIRNSYIKVIVQNRTNSYWFEQYLNRIYDVGVSDVKIIDDHFNQHFEDNEPEELNEDVDDTLTALTNYVRGMENLEVSTEKLENELKRIYNQAQYMEK